MPYFAEKHLTTALIHTLKLYSPSVEFLCPYILDVLRINMGRDIPYDSVITQSYNQLTHHTTPTVSTIARGLSPAVLSIAIHTLWLSLNTLPNYPSE